MNYTTVTSRYSLCIWRTLKLPNVNAKINKEILYFQMMNCEFDKRKYAPEYIFVTTKYI